MPDDTKTTILPFPFVVLSMGILAGLMAVVVHIFDMVLGELFGGSRW